MKVRFLGFSLNPGGGLSLQDFFVKHMVLLNGNEFDFNRYKRLCYIHNDKNIVIGLLLTIKNHKRFCELRDEGGALKIKVNTVGSDSDLMDFNFFVINTLNGLGLYQHYHNSCSINQFGRLLRRKFREIQDKLYKEELEAAGELSKKEENKLKKKYKPSMSFELMVRPEKLEELVKGLETIRSFEVDFFALKADEPEFAPMSPYLKKERRIFSFRRKTKAKDVVGIIKDAVTNLSIIRGRVIGRDVSNIERIIRISENPDNFGEYDYDFVAEKVNSLDLNDFVKSWVAEELRNKFNEYDHIFSASLENDN